MFCTQCGVEIQGDAKFCPACGTPTAGRPAADRPAPAGYRPLMLDKRNKKIAGVCAGFARYFDMDVTLIRIILLVLLFGAGVGFLAYIVAWIVMPNDYGMDPRSAMEQRSQAG